MLELWGYNKEQELVHTLKDFLILWESMQNDSKQHDGNSQWQKQGAVQSEKRITYSAGSWIKRKPVVERKKAAEECDSRNSIPDKSTHVD